MESLEAKLERYLKVTEKALKKAKVSIPKTGSLHAIALDFHSMAENYYNDSKHFKTKGDAATALASCSYAHAWLDAGARLGLFDVGSDNVLFTIHNLE